MESQFEVTSGLSRNFLDDSGCDDQGAREFSARSKVTVDQVTVDQEQESVAAQGQGKSVADSLRSDLSGLPGVVAESPLAALAMQLALQVDQGNRVADCARELRQCLKELKELSAGSFTDTALDQLQAKREQRRNA